MMLAVATLALALTACGPQVPDTTFVLSSDPALRNRVAELLPALAEKARMDLVRPVRVERRSREQLETYLVFKLDQELSPEKSEKLARSYSLFGMIPEGLDVREILLSVYKEQVAGFYDPDSAALFVMDDMPVQALEPILVHELVHAVQDQTANLDSLTAEERGNDRQAAAQSAIEGHATLVMLEYMAEQAGGQPVDLSQLPDLSQLLGPALESVRDQYPALASAPTVIQEALLFPYLRGASFVAAFWQSRGGRPPPFGADLPQSTEQILDPARAFGEAVDPPTELVVAAGGDWGTAYTNSLGQMEFQVLLSEHLGEPGRDLAQGWDGDRFALLETADGREGLVWASIWDSEGDRDRFLDGFRPALSGFSLPATLGPMELNGRPGAVLKVGVPDELTFAVLLAPER